MTDAVKRQDVFKKLVMNTAQEGFENLPASFALTGIVRIENDLIIP